MISFSTKKSTKHHKSNSTDLGSNPYDDNSRKSIKKSSVLDKASLRAARSKFNERFGNKQYIESVSSDSSDQYEAYKNSSSNEFTIAGAESPDKSRNAYTSNTMNIEDSYELKDE